MIKLKVMSREIQFVDVGGVEEAGDTEGEPRGEPKVETRSEDGDADHSSEDNVCSAEESVTGCSEGEPSDGDVSESESTSSSSSSSTRNKENAPSNVPSKDTSALEELLTKEWNLDANIHGSLKGKVTVESLKLLTERDLGSLFRTDQIDQKVRLRDKLQKWPESVQFISPREGPSRPKSRKLQLLNSSVRANDLDELLRTNETGKIVCKFYETHKRLDTDMQGQLAVTIANSYIADGRKFRSADMKKYAELITSRFKSEAEETYFCKRDITIKKPNPSGLLYHKYFNSKARKSLNPSKKKDKTAEKSTSSSPSSNVLTHGDKDDQAWLQNNDAPPDEVKLRWTRTFTYRKQTIDDLKPGTNLNKILINWPRFKDPDGPKFVDWDYDQHNPSHGNKLLLDWDNFVVKFLDYASNVNFADRSGRVLLEKIKQFPMSNCSRNYQVFKLIPVILKPKRGGNRKLPTIIDAQKDHIVHCCTANELGPAIERVNAKRESYQPTIIVVGASDTELEQFYVVKDGIFWKLCSFLKCIDVVSKSTVIFGLKFCPTNELFWAFIRSYFFKESGVVNSKAVSIVSLLNALK